MKFDISRNARQEYPESQRAVMLIPAGIFFLGILPAVLIGLGPAVDRWLGLTLLHFPPYNWIIGALLIVTGWPLAIWTIVVQFTAGRGTPIPAMAPQKLLVQPPYTLCRNPMVLGTIMAYLGVALAVGSTASAVMVIAVSGWLLGYIHRHEEAALLDQFGQEYADYRARTPFLLPRIKFTKRQS